VPSAQADGRLLGRAGRHVRRLAPQPDRLVESRGPLAVCAGGCHSTLLKLVLAVLPASCPGRAVGTGRWEAAGSSRPACPPASPAARSARLVARPSRGSFRWVRKLLKLVVGVRAAGWPGPAVGTGRWEAAGSSRPACPPASPAARSAGLVASLPW
jgi:hypothetical protein